MRTTHPAVLAALLLAVVAAPLAAQYPQRFEPTVLDWRQGPLDWRGPARPGGYVGVIGRAAAALGTETGGFEVWTWPLRVLTGFELDFQTPMYVQPVRGRDIARNVEVTPAAADITYVHSAFTVRQRIFAPLDEPAVAMVLEVEAIRPLEIIARFRADLEYAWPGGMGGQTVTWSDANKAFVLSESRRRHTAIVGSPFGCGRSQGVEVNSQLETRQPATLSRFLTPLPPARVSDDADVVHGLLLAMPPDECQGHVPRRDRARR